MDAFRNSQTAEAIRLQHSIELEALLSDSPETSKVFARIGSSKGEVDDLE